MAWPLMIDVEITAILRREDRQLSYMGSRPAEDSLWSLLYILVAKLPLMCRCRGERGMPSPHHDQILLKCKQSITDPQILLRLLTQVPTAPNWSGHSQFEGSCPLSCPPLSTCPDSYQTELKNYCKQLQILHTRHNFAHHNQISN